MIHVVIPNESLTKLLLLTSISLGTSGLEVLVLKKGMLPLGDTNNSINGNLTIRDPYNNESMDR